MCKQNSRCSKSDSATVSLSLPALRSNNALPNSPSMASLSVQDKMIDLVQATPKPLRVLLCSENVPRKLILFLYLYDT